jgi:NAD(P)-dependent dehydrogenase (short-subunit alcohol dehydrogenase family)
MELKLAGQSALVTGASRGIGLAIAQEFAREGVDLHLAARTASDLESARTAVLAAGKVEVECHALDLSNSENVAQLASRCVQVDILVNNAGAIPAGTLDAVNESRWREAWDLKVFGYINLSRHLYARMRERKAGVIVNVIGVAGERVRANYIAGTTGNAALMAFTRALGGASVDDNVRVVGVNPGQIETDRLRRRLETQAKAELGDATRWRELIKDPPLGRIGRADEIADMVVFLSSSRASFVSGTIITVDAGRASRNAA